jgi:hypothetical protein
MKQSYFWEADIHSAGQEMSRPFMETKGSVPFP